MRSSSAPAGDKGVSVWHLRYLFRFGWVLGCVSNGILGGFTSHAGTIFVVERVNRNALAGVDAPTCAWRIIICPSADIVVRGRDELCRSHMPVFAGVAVHGHHHGRRAERLMDRTGDRIVGVQERHKSRDARTEAHKSVGERTQRKGSS